MAANAEYMNNIAEAIGYINNVINNVKRDNNISDADLQYMMPTVTSEFERITNIYRTSRSVPNAAFAAFPEGINALEGNIRAEIPDIMLLKRQKLDVSGDINMFKTGVEVLINEHRFIPTNIVKPDTALMEQLIAARDAYPDRFIPVAGVANPIDTSKQLTRNAKDMANNTIRMLKDAITREYNRAANLTNQRKKERIDAYVTNYINECIQYFAQQVQLKIAGLHITHADEIRANIDLNTVIQEYITVANETLTRESRGFLHTSFNASEKLDGVMPPRTKEHIDTYIATQLANVDHILNRMQTVKNEYLAGKDAAIDTIFMTGVAHVATKYRQMLEEYELTAENANAPIMTDYENNLQAQLEAIKSTYNPDEDTTDKNTFPPALEEPTVALINAQEHHIRQLVMQFRDAKNERERQRILAEEQRRIQEEERRIRLENRQRKTQQFNAAQKRIIQHFDAKISELQTYTNALAQRYRIHNRSMKLFLKRRNIQYRSYLNIEILPDEINVIRISAIEEIDRLTGEYNYNANANSAELPQELANRLNEIFMQFAQTLEQQINETKEELRVALEAEMGHAPVPPAAPMGAPAPQRAQAAPMGAPAPQRAQAAPVRAPAPLPVNAPQLRQHNALIAEKEREIQQAEAEITRVNEEMAALPTAPTNTLITDLPENSTIITEMNEQMQCVPITLYNYTEQDRALYTDNTTLSTIDEQLAAYNIREPIDTIISIENNLYTARLRERIATIQSKPLSELSQEDLYIRNHLRDIQQDFRDMITPDYPIEYTNADKQCAKCAEEASEAFPIYKLHNHRLTQEEQAEYDRLKLRLPELENQLGVAADATEIERLTGERNYIKQQLDNIKISYDHILNNTDYICIRCALRHLLEFVDSPYTQCYIKTCKHELSNYQIYRIIRKMTPLQINEYAEDFIKSFVNITVGNTILHRIDIISKPEEEREHTREAIKHAFAEQINENKVLLYGTEPVNNTIRDELVNAYNAYAELYHPYSTELRTFLGRMRSQRTYPDHAIERNDMNDNQKLRARTFKQMHNRPLNARNTRNFDRSRTTRGIQSPPEFVLTDAIALIPSVKQQFINVILYKKFNILKQSNDMLIEKKASALERLQRRMLELNETNGRLRRELEGARTGRQEAIQEAIVERETADIYNPMKQRFDLWNRIKQKYDRYVHNYGDDRNYQNVYFHFTNRPGDVQVFCPNCAGAKRGGQGAACNYINIDEESPGAPAHVCVNININRRGLYNYTGFCIVCCGPTIGHQHINPRTNQAYPLVPVYPYDVVHGDLDLNDKGNRGCIAAHGGGVHTSVARMLAYRDYAREKILEAYNTNTDFELSFEDMCRRATTYDGLIHSYRERDIRLLNGTDHVNTIPADVHNIINRVKDAIRTNRWAEEILPPRPQEPNREQIREEVRRRLGIQAPVVVPAVAPPRRNAVPVAPQAPQRNAVAPIVAPIVAPPRRNAAAANAVPELTRDERSVLFNNTTDELNPTIRQLFEIYNQQGYGVEIGHGVEEFGNIHNDHRMRLRALNQRILDMEDASAEIIQTTIRDFYDNEVDTITIQLQAVMGAVMPAPRPPTVLNRARRAVNWIRGFAGLGGRRTIRRKRTNRRKTRVRKHRT